MIIKLTGWASRDPDEIERVRKIVEAHGLEIHADKGVERVVIAVKGVGDQVVACREELEGLRSVDEVVPISSPLKFVGKEFHSEPSAISVNGRSIGVGFSVIAGPCSVESEEQMEAVAAMLASCGVKYLRGGAFKPRTNPYVFQGLGEPGLKILRAAADRHHLAVVTEVMGVREVELVASYADIVQIGARNCQNFDLLKEVGKLRKAVLLKRGPSCTIEDFLNAAEYIVSGGNTRVILCVRGISTFEKSTRNAYDVDAIPVLKGITHLPVIADPSHAAGRRDIVPTLACIAAAAGADGIIVEVHPLPEKSVSDAKQTLGFPEFLEMMKWVNLHAEISARRRAAGKTSEQA